MLSRRLTSTRRRDGARLSEDIDTSFSGCGAWPRVAEHSKRFKRPVPLPEPSHTSGPTSGAPAGKGAVVERPLTILLWHVHGSWTTSFVHGPHRYLVACLPDHGPDGLGRATTYSWPDDVTEIDPIRAAS